MSYSRVKTIGEQMRRWTALVSVSDSRRSLHAICAGLLSCALAVAVATRYTDSVSAGIGHTTTIAQHDDGTKRQHIDKSSFTWTFSFANVARVEPPCYSLRATAFVPLAVLSLWGENLYNRPPPSL